MKKFYCGPSRAQTGDKRHGLTGDRPDYWGSDGAVIGAWLVPDRAVCLFTSQGHAWPFLHGLFLLGLVGSRQDLIDYSKNLLHLLNLLA